MWARRPGHLALESIDVVARWSWQHVDHLRDADKDGCTFDSCAAVPEGRRVGQTHAPVGNVQSAASDGAALSKDAT